MSLFESFSFLGGGGSSSDVAPATSTTTTAFDTAMAEDRIRPVPFQEIPNFPECDYEKNPTFLFKSIEQKNWPAVKRFLLSGSWEKDAKPDGKTPSSQVCTWVTKYEASIDGKEEHGKWTQLPIHAALVYGAPDAVIRILLKICPGTVQCADDQRMLPLHLAFRHGASDATIGFLLDLFPEAVHARDFNGHTPVEAALDGPHSQRGRVIQKIFQRNQASWKRQQAKLEAKQRKQKEKLSQVKESLKSKTNEVSNLNVAVDLIKWREDQTKKVLLTLMSELKDINGWYQQHEKLTTKEAIVEDLATRMVSLQQIAEELVAEAERQATDDSKSSKDPKQVLFGNLSSLMTNPSRAETEIDSLSAYSFGTTATGASFCDDKIQMNNHIVFLGAHDSPSNVSDSFGGQPLLMSKASFGRNRSTSSFSRNRSTSSFTRNRSSTGGISSPPEAIQEMAEKEEEQKEETLKPKCPLYDVDTTSIAPPSYLFQNIKAKVSNSTEPSEPAPSDSQRHDPPADIRDSPSPTATATGTTTAVASIIHPQNDAKQTSHTDPIEDSSKFSSSPNKSSKNPTPASRPPLPPSKGNTKKPNKTARNPFLRALKRVSHNSSKKQTPKANVRAQSNQVSNNENSTKVAVLDATNCIRNTDTNRDPRASAKLASVAATISSESADMVDTVESNKFASAPSNVRSAVASQATETDETGPDARDAVPKVSAVSQDSSDVSSKTSIEEECSHDEFQPINDEASIGSLTSDPPAEDETETVPEEIDTLVATTAVDNCTKNDDLSDDEYSKTEDEIDHTESASEQTSQEIFEQEYDEENEETVTPAAETEMEEILDESIEITEKDILSVVSAVEKSPASFASDENPEENDEEPIEITEKDILPAVSAAEDTSTSFASDENPEEEVEKDCSERSTSSVKSQQEIAEEMEDCAEKSTTSVKSKREIDECPDVVEDDSQMMLVNLPSQQTQQSHQNTPSLRGKEDADSVSGAETEDESMYIEIVDTYEMYPFEKACEEKAAPAILETTSHVTVEVIDHDGDGEVEVALPYEAVEAEVSDEEASVAPEDHADHVSNTGESQSIVSDLRSSFLGAVRKANKTASKIASKTKKQRKSASFNAKNTNPRKIGMNGTEVSPDSNMKAGKTKADLIARKKIFKSIVKQGAKVTPAAAN